MDAVVSGRIVFGCSLHCFSNIIFERWRDPVAFFINCKLLLSTEHVHAHFAYDTLTKARAGARCTRWKKGCEQIPNKMISIMPLLVWHWWLLNNYRWIFLCLIVQCNIRCWFVFVWFGPSHCEVTALKLHHHVAATLDISCEINIALLWRWILWTICMSRTLYKYLDIYV